MRRKELADFHVHTTDKTALWVIEQAVSRGVKTLALVGRGEFIENWDEIEGFGDEKEITVIPAVEYPVRLEGGNPPMLAEVIGFDFNMASLPLRKYFGRQENIRRNMSLAHKQKEFLESLGFVVEGIDGESRELLEEVLSGFVTEKAVRFCQVVAKNPKNQKTIEKMQKELDWDEFVKQRPKGNVAKFLWLNLFAPGKPGYIPVQRSASEIIDAFHEANGVVLYSNEGEFDSNSWKILLGFGIDGVLGWHGGQLTLSKEQIREIREKGLLILGGSDYDPRKDDWQIGTGRDNTLFISPRRYRELKDYKQRRFT